MRRRLLFLLLLTLVLLVPSIATQSQHSLTSKEKQWIDDHPTIRFGTADTWYQFISKRADGSLEGLDVDFIRYINQFSGLNIEIVTGKWEDMVERAQDRQIDGLATSAPLDERRLHFYFSDSYSTAYYVVVTSPQKKIVVNSIKDISGRTVALHKGIAFFNQILRDVPELKPVWVESDFKAYQAVLEDRADIALISNGSFAEFFEKFKGYIKIVHVIEEYPLNLVYSIRKDWPELVSIINKALSSMSQNQKLIIYKRWIPFLYDRKIDYTLIWRIIAAATITIILILFWNRRMAREISRRRAVETELIAARHAAEVASEAKTQFITNMSHEIRTPMSLVVGFSEILASTVQDQKSKDYLSKIRCHMNILLTLLNDILDISDLDSGVLQLKFSKVAPRELLQEIMQIFAARIKEKGLMLSVDISPEVPEIIIIDESRLRQILFNIIGNAVKFTDSGRIQIKIRRDDHEDRMGLIFSVEDTGAGIEPELREKIFEAFEKKDEYKMSKYGGLGLGLTITKRLIEIMGGEIRLESEVGKGSVFSVVLRDVKIDT